MASSWAVLAEAVQCLQDAGLMEETDLLINIERSTTGTKKRRELLIVARDLLAPAIERRVPFDLVMTRDIVTSSIEYVERSNR